MSASTPGRAGTDGVTFDRSNPPRDRALARDELYRFAGASDLAKLSTLAPF